MKENVDWVRPVEDQILNLLADIPIAIALIWLLNKVLNNQREFVGSFSRALTDTQKQLDKEQQRMDRLEAQEEQKEATYIKAIDNQTQAVQALTTAVRALDGRSGHTITLLQGVEGAISQHDERAKKGIEDILQAVNRVNDAVAEIKVAVSTLAKKGEMDMAVGRLNEAIEHLLSAKQECLEKKRVTSETPVVTVQGTLEVTQPAPMEEIKS